MPVLESLQPQEVLRFFEILSDIPRGSENEKQAADWVVNFARERGLEAFQDEKHCVVVRKPGQGGLENAPTLILHGHLDMVCAKKEGVEIDFLTEPITLVVDGDFIRADGTSLGADNGIGCSYILALLDSTDLPHPPLEAVMTAMEEKGKVGAGQFDTSVLTGTRMIDFNWITDHEILAGCSGDVTFLVDVPGEFEAVPSELSATRSLQVRGLLGGHCEFDIHLERANAILVLARVLNTVLARYDFRVSGLTGGTQNSAIPADAEAVLSLRPDDVPAVTKLIAELADTLHAEYERAGDDIRLELEETAAPERAFSAEATARFARLTALIPNGVLSWSLLTPGVVETSNNVGTLRPIDGGVRLASTITAQVTSRKDEIFDRVRVLAALAGGGVSVEQFGLDAPEFPYQENSILLKTAAEAYRDVIGAEPDIHVSQCSLELGMFSRKIPGLEIISIGTELHALHSPLESVNHTSVAKVWPLVREVVSRLS
ncbi:beta-Ala-His dipeptidase [Nakamurella flavida]|uniref:Beta-Ala-His dipeptidase n=1 Tax=Nakamurella flavida TaxID=363630 RepID=A0A938YCF5_9ACTN|nr:beta-Ala-His dipeptidase [Nakamurella flavida]MBM9475100.1 beta-Ala-His dipeptidase [Nakamurella flavida]MDP9776670.1 dipeptidase D [Nakamurella flavida]